jgi:hypothetical protein
MTLHTSNRDLAITLQLAEPQTVEMPNFSINELGLTRTRRVGGRDKLESMVIDATVRFDEIGRVAASTRTGKVLQLDVQHGLLERLQLQDRGISFLFSGRVKEIAVDGIVRPLPSRMEWLLHARPWHVGVGALAYILILLAAVLSWRTSHEPKPAQ